MPKICLKLHLFIKAADWGFPHVVRVLVICGATLEAQDNAGQTPLHKAAENRFEETVTSLIAHGADVNSKNNAGGTPLCRAILKGNSNAVPLLRP